MLRLHKRTKACEFKPAVVKRIIERDCGCIFCNAMYHMPDDNRFELRIYDIMHIVNRSQGGLGIEQNGVTGCRYHHNLLDNGNKGLRAEMLSCIESYMKGIYPGWDKSKLVYKKGAI